MEVLRESRVLEMEGNVGGRLVGSGIHGFHTVEDLVISYEEAKTRWLRPNEIHAILCNYDRFKINVKPLNMPPSGTVELFDRKMLRNFRKDGHNWKKKKDGKTVMEAHEHLKIGDEERIHVYYAHGEDKRTFVRRCYWLLDKKLENIVLVHYRDTEELDASLAVCVNSNSSSTHSDHSGHCFLSPEKDHGADFQGYIESKEHLEPSRNTASLSNFEMQLREINTLEWDDLLETNDQFESISSLGADKDLCLGQQKKHVDNGSIVDTVEAEVDSSGQGLYPLMSGVSNTSSMLVNDGFQSQESFGRWLDILSDSPGSVNNSSLLERSISTGPDSFPSPTRDDYQNTIPDHIFRVTDISPAWAFTTERTKILITGLFHGEWSNHVTHNLLCVCGNACVPLEIVQTGVLRCFVPPSHAPGFIFLFVSFDGQKPISQMINFEYRTPSHESPNPFEDKSKLEEFQIQLRLLRLLFSTSKQQRLKSLSSKAAQNVVKDAHKFPEKTAYIGDNWTELIKQIEDGKISFELANEILRKLVLKNKLQEWLLEKIIEGGCRSADLDDHGQGVFHLCAIAGYTWAVHLFSLSGISLDYRDKHGWTALHWAAYYGREKMVASLLSAGAKSFLVTDPTPETPGGHTASDFASKNGFNGLSSFLAQRGLVDHFEDMTIAGNISGSHQINTSECTDCSDLTEDEVYLKDTLAAYRTAADAAARIQAAFREQSFKLRMKAAESSNPEAVARNIVAAMRIQHAYRRYEGKKMMKAAVHIQCMFRTWKIRRDFLNMRRQAIKIQAAFRGFQERKQYHKIVWSVGVLEKVILRWLLKRRGFRGLNVHPMDSEENGMEGFFRDGRKQAEARVERSVVRVQAMFRSKQAQQEYRRIKLALSQAQLEFELGLEPMDV